MVYFYPILKSGLLKNTLCNRHISSNLRLKLFDAVVTPTILFGLAVLPLSTASLRKIEATQRKMLRKIVGWIRIQNEPWDVTMRRMKLRVARALGSRAIMPWKKRLAKYLWKFILRIKTARSESWIKLASEWEPNECDDAFNEYLAHRDRGRPNLRWDDVVNRFCRLHFHESWQKLSVGVLESSTDQFIVFFCNDIADVVDPPVFVADDAISVPQNITTPFVPFFRPSTDTW